MHNKSLHFVCRLGACVCEVVGAIRGNCEALQLQGGRGERSVFWSILFALPPGSASALHHVRPVVVLHSRGPAFEGGKFCKG